MYSTPESQAKPRSHHLKPVILHIGLALLSWQIHPTAWADENNSKANDPWSYAVGMDFWSLSPSAKENTKTSFVEENSNLLLPNSYDTWKYKNASPFLRINGNQNLSRDLSFHVKTRADQTMGVRVDEFNLQWEISPQLGLRAGVVEYKTSWCQTYETDSAWMRETDSMCATKQFQDVTGGAPGLQIYTNIPSNDYVIQTSFGIYDPLLLKYAPTEYGNSIPTAKEFQVTSNKKWGVNFNAVNIENGTEFRASYLHANQSGMAPDSSIQGNSQQNYDLIYLGANFLITANTRLKFTASQRSQFMETHSAWDDGFNYNEKLKITTKTLEMTHQYDSQNTWAASFSKIYVTLFDANFFGLDGSYQGTLDTAIIVPTNLYGLTWRHNFSQGFFSVLQYTHSQAGTWTSTNASELSQAYFPSYGHAIGARLGYQY